jgi:mono/diheme cytochrome c family protein
VGRRAALRAGLAGLLAAGAVLLALGGPARGGESARGELTLARAVTGDKAAAGRALFARMGCGSCHRFAAGEGIGFVGPDLDTVLTNYDAAMLRAKITNPYPSGPSESFAQMPAFSGRMSAAELDALVAFLLSTTRG